MDPVTRTDIRHALLAPVVERFPDQQARILQMALRNESFRGLCEDYHLARKSYGRLQVSPERAAEVAEYRTVIVVTSRRRYGAFWGRARMGNEAFPVRPAYCDRGGDGTRQRATIVKRLRDVADGRLRCGPRQGSQEMSKRPAPKRSDTRDGSTISSRCRVPALTGGAACMQLPAPGPEGDRTAGRPRTRSRSSALRGILRLSRSKASVDPAPADRGQRRRGGREPLPEDSRGDPDPGIQARHRRLGGRRAARRAPPELSTATMRHASGHRPYFEDAGRLARRRRPRQQQAAELRRLRRPEDAFVY